MTLNAFLIIIYTITTATTQMLRNWKYEEIKVFKMIQLYSFQSFVNFLVFFLTLKIHLDPDKQLTNVSSLFYLSKDWVYWTIFGQRKATYETLKALTNNLKHKYLSITYIVKTDYHFWGQILFKQNTILVFVGFNHFFLLFKGEEGLVGLDL